MFFRCLLILALLPLAAWAQDPAASPRIFSGELQTYEDSLNGYRFQLPVEFTLKTKGYSTNWDGPFLGGSASSVFVNVTPMPGVHPQVLYESIIRSKKADRALTDIKPVKFAMKLKGKPVYGFSCREADVDPGTGQPKADSDIYRYFLFVWGNERAYEVMLGCNVGTHRQGLDINPVVAQIMKSFTPLKTTP